MSEGAARKGREGAGVLPSRTFSPWQRAMPPAVCDVAVVGGGIMAAATAYALRRLDPSLRVALLEAETLAFGASGRNAGFLLLGTHTDYASAVEAYGRDRARRLWRFTAENAALVRDELDGRAFDLRFTGNVLAAGDAAEAERLRRATALLAEDGVETEYVDGEAANARLGTRGFAGVQFVSEGGTLHPAKLVRHLAALSGATVLEGSSVDRIAADGAGVRLGGPSGTLTAGQVVLTLNAYLPRLVPEAARFVRPVRAQMLATAPVAPVTDRPVYSHEGFYYLRQQPDGRLLLGGARHRHVEAEVGYADLTTGALQADLLTYLRDHFPAAGAPAVERRWSGTMGFSPDSLPVVGAVPGVPGARFATGFTGHGMGFGVRFGYLLARTVLGQTDDAADLFDAVRFGAPGGNVVRS